MGADEAHRPRPAPARLDPLPGRPPRAHRVRPVRRGHAHRAADGARRDVGEGHQPPPRAAPREPALPPPPTSSRSCSSSPTASRPRTSSRAARCSSTTRRTPAPSPSRSRELDVASRLGAQTTFFRLGEDPGLARFVESMAKRRAAGRRPELGDLGAAVVGSYLGSRRPPHRSARPTVTSSAGAASGPSDGRRRRRGRTGRSVTRGAARAGDGRREVDAVGRTPAGVVLREPGRTPVDGRAAPTACTGRRA